MSTDIQLKPEHLQFVKNVAKKEGFITYDLELSSGSAKGENYLSHIYLANVEEKNNNKELNLVLKVASDKEDLRKYLPYIEKGFIREIYVYETVLPALLKFQKEYIIPDRFGPVAKVYLSDLTFSKEIVIFENIKNNGFKLWNRKLPMNEEHISLVLRQYAKLHAISFAMSELEPKQFEALTASMDNVWIPDSEEKLERTNSYTDFSFDCAGKTLNGLEEERQALKRFKETYGDLLMNVFSVSSDDDLVVVHGDCWCNNMLFKYEDPENPNKPTQVCLIDWQLSRKGSPAIDLCYYLFCSVSGKDLCKNIDRYLKVYHDTLSENLKQFGCDVGKIFPYTLLEKHFRKYSLFGWYMTLMIMRALVQETEEAKSLEDLTNQNDKLFEFELKNVDLYSERMRDIVSFIVKRKLI